MVSDRRRASTPGCSTRYDARHQAHKLRSTRQQDNKCFVISAIFVPPGEAAPSQWMPPRAEIRLLVTTPAPRFLDQKRKPTPTRNWFMWYGSPLLMADAIASPDEMVL